MKLSSSWTDVSTDYKLIKVLGEGGGGQVIKAIHRGTKKNVAIKKIDCSFDDLDFMRYVT
jgi:serine/threonine protein kinase